MTTFPVNPEALVLVQRNWTVYHTKWEYVEAGFLDDDDLVLVQRGDKIYHMRIGDYRDGTISLGELDFVWANLYTRDRNEFVPSWKHFHFPWTSVRGLKFTVGDDDTSASNWQYNTRIQLRVYGARPNWDGMDAQLIYPDGTSKKIISANETVLNINGEYFQTDPWQKGEYLLVGSFDYIDFFKSGNLINISCTEEIWNMMFWWSPGSQTDKQNHTFRANSLGTEMFHQCSQFEGNINGWENLRMRNFTRMFRDCKKFNQDVSGLVPPPDRNKADYMFGGCEEFNNGGSPMTLDMASCEDMRFMFFNCRAFNADITGWDVRNVTNMADAFALASVFNQPIGSWNVTNVTNMVETFRECEEFDQDLGGWDVKNVKDMEGMFAYGDKFNNGGSDYIKWWDVSKVENFYYMFAQLPNFNQPIGNWETTAHVDDHSFEEMFEFCTNFDQDLSGWCVDKVTQVPNNFAIGTPIDGDLAKLPVWGTCP